MNITSGKIESAQKVVIYGPEGIGKSTFASQFPEPLFIDTEGSTKKLDVRRMDRPSSWMMMAEQVRYIKSTPNLCKTLIIDTLDWAEMLCMDNLLTKSNMTSIEDFGYGKGYVYLAEEVGKMLNALTELVEDYGINVVLLAHAAMRKFEQPNETGSYDRWELKLQKKTSPIVKEWADMVLFANYKTIVIKDKNNKAKGSGGERIMYTTFHPCWDAKNRDGLPDEMPFDYKLIEHLFINIPPPKKVPLVPWPGTEKPVESVAPQVIETPVETPTEVPKEMTWTTHEEPKQAVEETKPVAPPAEPVQDKAPEGFKETTIATPFESIPPHLNALLDLMEKDEILEEEVQAVVAAKKYFPADTPLANYPADFVMGALVADWPKVKAAVLEQRT